MYDWNENALSLGRPDYMDTPTLIEWIQRQLETVEETSARLNALQEERHRKPSLILTLNEQRLNESASLDVIREALYSHANGKTMILSEGMTVTYLNEVKDMRQVGEAFCSDCPDHEGCMQAAPCSLVKRVNKKE